MTEQGVIFDLDGTLVDSTAHYRATWAELIGELGAEGNADEYVRRETRENARLLLGREREESELDEFAAMQAARARSRMNAQGVAAHPGMVELVKELHARGVRLAVATAAERENAEWTLEQLGLRGRFETVVVDRDVERGKPAPDIYREALRRLDLGAEKCVVIEDSAMGVRAARAAGLRAIAVVTTHSASELAEAGAIDIIPDTATLTADQVLQFVSAANAAHP